MDFFKKKWVWAVIFVLAISLAVVAWRYLESSVKASYEFVEAGKADIEKFVSATGEVKSAEAVELAFEATGKVAAVNVQVGDQVKVGQQLAILDQTDYSDQVNQALANLDIAQAGLVQAEAGLKKEKERKEELINTHASKYTVDVQKAQIKAAQAAADIQRAQIVSAQVALRSARDQHQKIILTSPIDGIVTARNIEVGETTGPTAAAISVINENKFKIEAGISQVDIAEVEVGERARISFDSCHAGDIIESQVVSIDPAGTEGNGNLTYKVNLDLGRITDCMKAGATANVEVAVQERKDVLAVPSSSVIKRNNQYFVLLQDAQQGLKEKEVKIGVQGSNGMTEIISGIEEGEKVVSFSK